MANFDSPISRKKMAEEQLAQDRLNTIKRYSVSNGDEESQQPILNNSFSAQFNEKDFENELKQAKQNKLQDRLSPEAKKRIEMLTGMTRMSKEVPVGETIFSLRTLTSKEAQEAAISGTSFDTPIKIASELRNNYLARSIFRIGQVDIALFLESNSIEAKLEFIGALDDILVEKLYDSYNELLKESKSKYGLISPEIVKEVSEDLKK